MRDDARIAALIETLESTADPAIRNAAALALADLRDARAVAPLVRVISRPENQNHRGTLVHALRGFDCSPYLDQVFEWVIEGNFEVSREAFLILEELEGPLASTDVARNRAKLRQALPNAESEDKRLLLEQLLELTSAT